MIETTERQAEDAVRDVLIRVCDAWEHGDGKAYASFFSEDAQFVTATGKRMLGRKSIAKESQEILNTLFRGSKLGRSYRNPNNLRFITPDVALVESAGSVLFPGETEDKVAPNGLMTFVVARRDDAWRIVSFQNTPTGRWHTIRLIWRYLLSRLSASRSRAEASKA
jgi:uncharacterized protein (TIGR02246 family)